MVYIRIEQNMYLNVGILVTIIHKMQLMVYIRMEQNMYINVGIPVTITH
jgi:hypothetical protein